MPQWVWVYEACFGEKGLHAVFLGLCACLFSFYPEGLLEVCLCVFEVLGCVFSLLFFSARLWLLLNKQSAASSELVAHSFGRCLVCGLVSALMCPVIKNYSPFVSPSLQKMIIIGVVCAVLAIIILIIILSQTL